MSSLANYDKPGPQHPKEIHLRARIGAMTNLQSLLGIELPIIQAPMAGVQGGALAVAVSSTGALG